MKNIIIETIINTVQPLSIKLPESKGQKEEFGGFPTMIVGQDSEGLPIKSGYLPATTVRGLLRRMAAFAAMTARGNGNTPVATAYAEFVGQRGKETEDLDLAQVEAVRASSPILDMFGTWQVKSRLLVSNFMPQHPILPQTITGVRKDLDSDPEVIAMLSDEDRDLFWNRSELNSQRAAADAVVKQLESQVRKLYGKAKDSGSKGTVVIDTDLQVALDEAKTKAEAVRKLMDELGLGDMKNSSKNLSEYWYMPAGIQLKGKIVIERAKEHDLDMILQALNAFSLRPLLGAQSARGCGEVAATFTVKTDGVIRQVITVGGWEPARGRDFSAATAAETIA